MLTPLATMSLSVHSICSKYSMGTFCQACCTGGTEGSVLMVLVPGMLPMVSKELGNACFNAIMSQTWAVVQGEVALGNCALGIEALEQRQCTRMGFRVDVTVVEGGFCTWSH